MPSDYFAYVPVEVDEDGVERQAGGLTDGWSLLDTRRYGCRGDSGVGIPASVPAVAPGEPRHVVGGTADRDSLLSSVLRTLNCSSAKGPPSEVGGAALDPSGLLPPITGLWYVGRLDTLSGG